MRLAACCTGCLVVVLTAVPARAERRDATTAEALFRAARVSAQHGDYAAACPKFEESNRLDPTVGTVFNLADCNEHLGKVASAWQLFKEAAQRFAPSDDRLAIANTRASRLEPKLPRLLLKADPPLPADAVVRRDGVQLGTASFGVPLPLDPGDHTVTVEMPGRTTTTRTVRIDIAQLRELPLEVGQPVASAVAGRVRPSEVPGAVDGNGDQPRANRRTWGAVLLGVGGAGIATSLVFGGLALSEKSKVDDACNGSRCSDEGLQAADRGKLDATVSTVAFGAGALAAAVGTYLLVSGGSSAARAGVSGALGPGGGFVGVSGTFQ